MTEEIHQLREEVARLRAQVEELDANRAVRETLLDYAFHHDRGLSDAVLDITGFGDGLDTKTEGREAIRNMYRQIDARSDGPPPYKHGITNLRIEIQGEQALTSSYLLDWGGVATDLGPGGSIYHERLIKQADGQWLIKHKRIVCTKNLTVDAVLSVDI